MVDSAQQAASELKAELADLQQELEEARRAADDSMMSASRTTEAAARETDALRCVDAALTGWPAGHLLSLIPCILVMMPKHYIVMLVAPVTCPLVPCVNLQSALQAPSLPPV